MLPAMPCHLMSEGRAGGSTRKEMCACGVVRQLQVVLGRCEGPQHAVVVRKVCAYAAHPLNLHSVVLMWS